jgi:hypothetical protein
MKVKCPVCGFVGILQQRGNSYRVQHYQGFENGKRSYLYHKVSNMEVNGSKNMEVSNESSSFFSRTKWTGGDLNPRPPECKSGVHTN